MSVQNLFLNVATRWPDTVALHEPATGQTLSFGDMQTALQGFGAFLAAQGVTPGARVGILADASIPYLIADYGSMVCGYVRVPFDPSLSVEELRNQISDADIAILLHDPTHAELAEQAAGATCVSLPKNWPISDAPTALTVSETALSTLASLNYTGAQQASQKRLCTRRAA
ncbi:AMP-binding protein [Acetobacter persici]|uniref:AMP-binding protein n=1 Tax=Acetobacter persici TaxID=1076596 RepID=UPI001AD7FB8E|nr:AMP-binding protein [Acetobacter persici]